MYKGNKWDYVGAEIRNKKMMEINESPFLGSGIKELFVLPS